MMRIPVGDFVLNKEEKDAIVSVLERGRISEWRMVREFEESFARYVGSRYCVAVNSGTSALMAGLLALMQDDRFPKARRGAKVITSPVTYVATANALVVLGFEPVFADIDDLTFALLPEKVEEAILREGPETVAGILPVHLMGYSNDMDKLTRIASRYNLFLFEDSAQAHGTVYKGRKTGSLGHLADFSFYIAHNIQAGEMGCITTDDEQIYKAVTKLKANGRACTCVVCTRHEGVCPFLKPGPLDEQDIDPRFLHDMIGLNFKTTEFSAALAVTQIRKADWIFATRIENVRLLNELLRPLASRLRLPLFDPSVSYLAYPFLLLENSGISRARFRHEIERRGLENRPLFGCIPSYQPSFLPWKAKHAGLLPNAETVGKTGVYIGCHQYLEDRHIRRAAEIIFEVIGSISA
jgi:dTDP-4-amino-4,6-dideoxygalactose transaminase